ncbi:arginine/ornithine transport system permease protein [Inhella inkyongensis]|uniref:Arginine/ornithine transport system permease protein n=1 Tax=Inhella inkyongensis TaxID=392593 RepID=A0A840S5K7_9BURK|nr:ABC transporter permease [Inhella inkyongensis]MBB5203911.1 arginine/ornithine transport system permease protein [Inhella inkyongensis]
MQGWQTIIENLPLFFSGAWVTLQLLAISLALGLVMAVPLGVLRALPSPWLNRPVWLYTYVFRGTPMLVQLFILYYGLGQFEAVRQSFAWTWLQEPWFCACLAFVLNTGAYTTEIIAGAIKALPAGEIEAAKAYGMGRATLMRRIVLPAALRRALPAYGNEAIFMLHGTSIAMLVTIADVTGVAKRIYATHYIPFEAYITAGCFYFAMTLCLVGLFRWAENRYLKPLLPR